MNTRNTTIKSILLLLALCYLGPAHTQILAPDFQCVVNDTLFWEPATNNCGPFVSYDIYFSADEAGPYTLLNSITDPTETFFFHSDANNQIWYYYLTSNYNCPGETQLSSDTLDNLIPIAGPLEYVSVLGGGVEISWGASPSPETIGYVISRNTDQGTTVLDTVYDTTIYLDLSAEPELQSEVYFVVALDACGNKSLVPPPHQTILLDFMPPDACNPGLVLNWTAYQNWANGVGGYDIFVGADGETPELVGSVGGAETTFTYTGGNDGELLCFYVEAIENNTGFRARSNEECTGINILQPIREIELLGASVNENGTVDLEWYWDPTALLVSADQASVAVGDDAVVVQSLTLDNPLQEQNLRQDPNANAQNRAYIYTIFATDECGNMVNSNDSQTPFLQGVAGANSNQLSWNAYAHPLGQALNYTLIRVSDLGEETVFSGITNDLSFDDVVPSDLEGEGLCYYLLVEVEFERSNGEVLIRELRSNTVCLVPSPKVFVPNVFAPNGVNNIFRPQLSFGDLAEYELNIYDRWGGQVFQSASIDKGWDGRRNGEVMPQGVYLYFISLRLAGGETVELQGDVMLLR